MSEPTEAQVEAAAKAIADCYNPGMFERDPEKWRDEARAALVAAQGAAPVLPSSGVDEDKLAEVIRKLRFNDEGCRDDCIDCTESVSDHADDIARAVAEWLEGQGGESYDIS